MDEKEFQELKNRIAEIEGQIKWIHSYLTSELSFRPTPDTVITTGNVHRLLKDLSKEIEKRVSELNEDFETKWERHEIVLKGTNTTWGVISRVKLLWGFLIPLWAAIGGIVALVAKELFFKIFSK